MKIQRLKTPFFFRCNPKIKISFKIEKKQKILKNIKCFETIPQDILIKIACNQNLFNTDSKVRGEIEYIKSHITNNSIEVKYSSNYIHMDI